MSFREFKFKEVFNVAVIVATLGYFVDIYDLVLFLIIGKKSLVDLGHGESIGNFQFLLDVQMIGMLIGGLVWGILGDKKGRLSVLFGSIIMYSLANIANGFVAELTSLAGGSLTTLQMYAVLRFIAGFGLAGELGAGITLVSEIMSKETRGFGTMVIAAVGVTGAVVAGFIGKIDWRIAYFIGGGLGLSLLLLRIGVFESGMFKKLEDKKVKQGEFFALFGTRERALRYICCILIGLPVWFIIGVLIGRAPLLAKDLGITGVEQEYSVMFCYSGLAFGDFATGMLSQIFKSRKKVLYLFYTMCCITILIYLNLDGASLPVFYAFIFILGFSVGFWAIFITVASEQFGTNLRATAATTVPNFVRGSLVPIAMLFDFLNKQVGSFKNAALIVTVIVMVIAFFSLYHLKETFGKSLDYLEE